MSPPPLFPPRLPPHPLLFQSSQPVKPYTNSNYTPLSKPRGYFSHQPHYSKLINAPPPSILGQICLMARTKEVGQGLSSCTPYFFQRHFVNVANSNSKLASVCDIAHNSYKCPFTCDIYDYTWFVRTAGGRLFACFLVLMWADFRANLVASQSMYTVLISTSHFHNMLPPIKALSASEIRTIVSIFSNVSQRLLPNPFVSIGKRWTGNTLTVFSLKQSVA